MSISKNQINQMLNGLCNNCDRPLYKGIAHCVKSTKQNKEIAVCSDCLIKNSKRGIYQK